MKLHLPTGGPKETDENYLLVTIRSDNNVLEKVGMACSRQVAVGDPPRQGRAKSGPEHGLEPCGTCQASPRPPQLRLGQASCSVW